MKILSPDCSWKMSITLNRSEWFYIITFKTRWIKKLLFYIAFERERKKKHTTGKFIFMHVRLWSESSLCAQLVAKDPSFLHADSEDSDQTGRMPRLIWVFAGRTFTLLVLTCSGSIITFKWKFNSQEWNKQNLLNLSDVIKENTQETPKT